MSAAPDGIDMERVDRLFVDMMRVVIAHYQAGPTRRDRVYEVLNALAALTTIVSAGTGDLPAALRFFNKAVEMHIPQAQAKAAEFQQPQH
jgi:hypothetical protein